MRAALAMAGLAPGDVGYCNAHGTATPHTGEVPNRIWLYRRPILDYWAEHEETLGAIVTHVLVHEIGHQVQFGQTPDLGFMKEWSKLSGWQNADGSPAYGLSEQGDLSGFDPSAFASAEEFLAWEGSERVDCLILDVAMRGMTGPQGEA